MLNLEQFDELRNLKDELIASMLLHDSIKMGWDDTNKWTVVEHPNLAQCDFDDGRKTEIRRRADERRSSPQPFSAEELVKALSFDDACQRSEQRGYVKGRNERIDIEQLSPSFATADETEHRARYRQIFSAPRKSVWDD